MVKDDGPVKRVQDLKGGTIGVVGIKTATDLWARAGLLNAGLVPDKDTKVVPMAFPAIGEAVRSGKVTAGTFVEPSTQPRWRKAACASSSPPPTRWATTTSSSTSSSARNS